MTIWTDRSVQALAVEEAGRGEQAGTDGAPRGRRPVDTDDVEAAVVTEAESASRHTRQATPATVAQDDRPHRRAHHTPG